MQLADCWTRVHKIMFRLTSSVRAARSCLRRATSRRESVASRTATDNVAASPSSVDSSLASLCFKSRMTRSLSLFSAARSKSCLSAANKAASSSAHFAVAVCCATRRLRSSACFAAWDAESFSRFAASSARALRSDSAARLRASLCSSVRARSLSRAAACAAWGC
jgi:hypothetical protein